jgi:hypothetical protein
MHAKRRDAPPHPVTYQDDSSFAWIVTYRPSSAVCGDLGPWAIDGSGSLAGTPAQRGRGRAAASAHVLLGDVKAAADLLGGRAGQRKGTVTAKWRYCPHHWSVCSILQSSRTLLFLHYLS